MSKKIVLLITLIALFTNSSKATHLMGGEITWKCLGNGNYIFQMKVYRDCATPVPIDNAGPIALAVHNHPSVTSIPMNIISFTDITPQCNPIGPSYDCNNPGGNTAVQEYILESNPVNLPGIPPAAGWIFTWTNCCRNAAITNLNLTFGGPGTPNNGITLRAKMFAYPSQDSTMCTSSSPIFTERPNIIVCAGMPFEYNSGAYPNGDSLSFEFAESLDYSTTGVTFPPPVIPFNAGYNINSPFPNASSPFNSNNIPVNLNPITGAMTLTCYNVGNFVSVVKVSSYKCGQKVAEIYREIQTVVLSCGADYPPDVTAPFIDTASGLFTNYTDTVMAGDLVSFSLTASDSLTLPFPLNFIAQHITYTANGGEFGSNYSNPNSGCDYPPCATLNLPPPQTGVGMLTVNFNWQTDCNHVRPQDGCYNNYSLYKFLFKFTDDYCPVPAYVIKTVNIIVKSASTLVPQITLNDTLLVSSPGQSYSWFLNGILLPDSTQTIMPLVNGSYTVHIGDSGSCVVSSSPYIVSFIQPPLSSINEQKRNIFSVYPNPAQNIIYIKSFSSPQLINAYSNTGEIVPLKLFNNEADISSLAKGFYILEIKWKTHVERVKLIKN